VTTHRPSLSKALSTDATVPARLRTRIRLLLAKFDYPPEEEREAVIFVIEQMETIRQRMAPKISWVLSEW
jgi:type I restriction enzyme, R subunit